MVYDHAVKVHGKYYPAGAEVPEENQIIGTPAEDVPPETEEKKPGRTRKSAQEKTE